MAPWGRIAAVSLIAVSRVGWGCFAELSLEKGLRQADRVVVGRIERVTPNAVPFQEPKAQQSADDFQGSLSLRDVASRAVLTTVAGLAPASGFDRFELGYPGSQGSRYSTVLVHRSTDLYHHEGEMGVWLLRWVPRFGVWTAAYHPDAWRPLSGKGSSGREALTRLGWWHRSITLPERLFQPLETMPLPPAKQLVAAEARSPRLAGPPRGTAWLIRHPWDAFIRLPPPLWRHLAGRDYSREAVLVIGVKGILPPFAPGHSMITREEWRDPESVSAFSLLTVTLTVPGDRPEEAAPSATHYALMSPPTKDLPEDTAMLLNVYLDHSTHPSLLATGLAPSSTTTR